MLINVSLKFRIFPAILAGADAWSRITLPFPIRTPYDSFHPMVPGMPRELSKRDLSLLSRMVPECGDLTCESSGLPFRSLLPPVSNHFSAGPDDFGERIGRLDREDLVYLLDLIRDGSESLGCLPPENASVLIDLVARQLGTGAAAEVLEIYESGHACDD